VVASGCRYLRYIPDGSDDILQICISADILHRKGKKKEKKKKGKKEKGSNLGLGAVPTVKEGKRYGPDEGRTRDLGVISTTL